MVLGLLLLMGGVEGVSIMLIKFTDDAKLGGDEDCQKERSIKIH